MLTLISTLVVLCGGVVVLWVLVGSLNRSRLYEAARAQLSKGGRSAIEADPIAVLQDRRDQAAQTLSVAINAQSDCRGHLESVKRQVIEGDKEVNRLDAKIKSALNVKDEDRAMQCATQLQREKEHLIANKEQLERFQVGYDVNMKKIRSAQSAIQNVDEEARALKTQLKFSQVERELGDMMSKVQVGVDMGSMNEAKEEAKRQIDRNRGAVLVRAELECNGSGVSEIEALERERQDQARALLDEYKKSM